MAKDPTIFARKLRRSQTGPEERLWTALRNRRLGGFKFRRQMPMAGYVVDFLCQQKRLIVEVDGPSHLKQVDYDQERTRQLEALGFLVVRLTNDNVMDDLNATLDAIDHNLRRDVT